MYFFSIFSLCTSAIFYMYMYFSHFFFHLHFSYFSVSILNFRSFLSHFIFLSAIYFVFFQTLFFSGDFLFYFLFFCSSVSRLGAISSFQLRVLTTVFNQQNFCFGVFLRTFFAFFLSLASFYELTFKLDTILVFKESFDLVVKHNSLPSQFDTFFTKSFFRSLF